MKHNLRALGALASIAVAATTFLSQAQAAPVLSLVLTPATDVAFTDAVGVDIFVSGLTGLVGGTVGGYAFNLTFDDTRMSEVSFSADPDVIKKMGDGADRFTSFNAGSGSIHFDVLADLALTEADLLALQGTGFRLGRAEFTARNTGGFAAFGLSGFSLSEFDGLTAIQGVTATGAQVCVSANGAGPCASSVPEPMSALLVAVALGGLALSRRQAKAA